MKLFLTTFLVAILAALAMAVDPQEQKSIIVSYPKDTPESEMTELKDAIHKAGGIITHEYNLFIGLAAKVPAYFVETIRTMGEDHDVTVEDDQTVSINSESP